MVEFSAEHIIRHEAGHAVVGHVLGRSVRAMVWRVHQGRSVQGDVDLGPLSNDPEHLIILSAGLVADYLNSQMLRIDDADAPLIPTFDDMVEWEQDIFASASSRAIADADLKAMRRIRTGGRYDPNLDPYIADGPREYVQRAIDILNEHWDTLCELVDYAEGKEPGIGPRELKRFFDGKPSTKWARLLDAPRVRMARWEQWKFRGKIG